MERNIEISVRSLMVSVFIASSTLLAAASTTVDTMNYSVDRLNRATTFQNRRATGKYIVVRLTIKNDGRSAANMSSRFRLRCGADLYASSNVTDFLKNESPFSPLNPGLSRKHTVVFDVPLKTRSAACSVVIDDRTPGISKHLPLD